MRKRPLSVLLIAVLYIAVGAVGLVAHFPGISLANLFRFDGIGIELTELAALLSGIYLLRAQNWARWLAVAWMALHVVISVLDAYRGFVVHCLLLALIAWALFYPGATSYFQPNRIRD